MSTIRYRGDENLVVATPTTEVTAGGYVSGEQNSLMNPGAADVSSLNIAPPSYTDTAKAALRETLAARALRGSDYLNIPSEPGFDVARSLGDRLSLYNADELEFLGDARSSTELAQREAQVGTTRKNYQDMAGNPLTAIASSLFDADLVIGLGVGKLASAGRLTRLATAVTANTAVLGLAAEGGTVSPIEVIGSSLGAALGALPTVARASRVAAVAEDAELAAIRTAEEVVPEAVPTRIPDPDYIPPTPDTITNRVPFMDSALLKNRKTLNVNVRDVVGAVLNNADDLPLGTRQLGLALHESLGMDDAVPAVLRSSATREVRDKVVLSADGKLSAVLSSKEGIASSLSETVAQMNTYDKSIMLHEAAHAKTLRNISAWQRGTLIDGPVKESIGRINDLREYTKTQVFGKAQPYNVTYGLKDNHEFVSQLFNSEEFRNVLQSIPLPAEKRSVLGELTRRVVQAFTGKAQTDTVFDSLVSEFENLLKYPADNRVAKARMPQDMPTVQSAPLSGAKDLTDLAKRAGAAINQNFSLYERLRSFGTKSAQLADQLVVDATGSASNSATHYARTAYLASNVSMAQVDAAIAQGISQRGWNLLSRMRNPSGWINAHRELSEEVYAKLAENHRVFRAGGEVTPHSDPVVDRVVQAFGRSGWAEDSLQRIKTSGMLGADQIEASPWYLPRRHSANRVDQYLRDNPDVTRADVEAMYANQFQRMFAEQGIQPQTAKALGRQMLRNMEERAAGVSGYRQHIAGMSIDDIEFAMRNAGIDEDQIDSFLGTIQRAGDEPNTAKNLKRRADFDMTADFQTKSGKLINPQLFVDKDVLGLMEGYSRNMSGRIGLAQAGFPDIRELATAVDRAAAEAVDPRIARDTLDNTVNQIMGFPTGENVPDILRSFSVASGAVNLANSGVFQLADSAMVIKQFGITKVLRAMSRTEWGRSGLEIAQSKEYGARLGDILNARHVLSGRYRSVMTHLDDNTDVGSMGFAHQMVQHFGQSTRFVNGMEYVRRAQSKLTAGLIADTMDDAFRGNAAAAEMLQRFGLTDDLLSSARTALKEGGEDMRMWPSSIRLELETVGHNMADALVQENRLGEIPAWMQFSTLGKFILPYMNFVAGAWNKVLRRTFAQEGAKGVAMLAAYQLPLQTLASTVALAQGGKEINSQSLTENVLTQLPLMSWMGYAVNMLTQGPTANIAALSMVDKAYSATAGILSGDASMEQIVRATPFLSIIPGVRIMASAIDEQE